MAKNQELQVICDRLTQAAGEFKSHAVQLAQLDREVQGKQAELASLQTQIDQAQGLAKQVTEIDQQVRAKRSELADLNAEIAKKHALHGQADSALRDLRKRISGDPTHA